MDPKASADKATALHLTLMIFSQIFSRIRQGVSITKMMMILSRTSSTGGEEEEKLVQASVHSLATIFLLEAFLAI